MKKKILMKKKKNNKYNNIKKNSNQDENNNEVKKTFTESLTKEEIKNCIKKMNETNNVQYARDAVTIYTTILQPLFNTIRNLKKPTKANFDKIERLIQVIETNQEKMINSKKSTKKAEKQIYDDNINDELD